MNARTVITPFIDPPAIAKVCRDSIPLAEQAAQDACIRGDLIEYERRTADASWYRSLLDQYGGEDAT